MRAALTINLSNGSRNRDRPANSSSCARSSGKRRNAGTSVMARRSSGRPMLVLPSSRSRISSATTAAGTQGWHRPVSTSRSALRARGPSFCGAASMKTQAWVSTTYLRGTAGSVPTEAIPQDATHGREVGFRRHRGPLVEAEQPAAAVLGHLRVRYLPFEPGDDLGGERTPLPPCPEL